MNEEEGCLRSLHVAPDETTRPIEFLPMPRTASVDKALIVKVQKRAKAVWDKTLAAYRRTIEPHLNSYRLNVAKQGKARFMKQKPSRQTRKRMRRKYT